ncbi:MAG: hypothetical protein K2X47_07435 [Bdellovibrionales bacterium]|nr:hypothetical protein [Bdellovibrionales bacterium]
MLLFRSAFFLTILLGFTSPMAAHAQLFTEMNPSIRALGMGNAYTSIVDDSDALFYNPAALCRIEGVNWRIMNPRLGLNGQEAVTTASALGAVGGNSLADRLAPLFGKRLWLGGGLQSVISVPCFGFGVYEAADVAFNLSNPALPTFYTNVINDIGLLGGIGFSLVPGLNVGMSINRMYRIGSNVPLGIDTIVSASGSTLTSQIDNRGVGYAVDLGMQFVFPSPAKPTFSFVWKNAGQTRFIKESGSQSPPMIRDEMIVGLGLSLELPLMTIKPAIDFKYLNWYEEQMGKKIHVGIEVDLPVFAVRGGFNQGYYTMGLGVDLQFARLDVATYGVERGVYPGQSEDRRYVAQLTIELGFNPNMSFLKGMGGGGSGRKGLKPRR